MIDFAALADAFATFRFLRPMWLAALVAVPVLVWWLRRRRLDRNVWRAAVDPHLLPHLIDGAGGARGVAWTPLAMGLACALAVLAMAGPSWRSLPQPLWQDRAPLVVAVDLSEATLATDLPPSRLLQMRAKLTRILRAHPGGQIALVAFADDAYIVSPLTDDAANIELFVESLSPDVMPDDGHRPELAIRESALLLERAGLRRGDILLVTHRATSASRRAAAEARGDGFRVSVLGMGTPEGGPFLDRRGRESRSRLEPSGLRAVADAGGGRYVQASMDDADLRELAQSNDGDVGQADASGARRGALALDEGFWLLPPLLLLALFAFRRGVFVVALLAICLPWRMALADDGAGAASMAHARLRDGVAAYRERDYAGALRAWKDLPSADAAYNRGNALARQGRYDDAIAEYDKALRLQPGMADAVENRRIVDDARKRRAPPRQGDPQENGQARRSPPQPGGNGQGDAQDNPSKHPPQDGQPQAGPATPARPGARTQGVPQPAQGASRPGDPPPEPREDAADADGDADVEAQRKADAAQRERMRGARAFPEIPSKPATGSGAVVPAAKKPASKDERARMRMLANDVWLRRVPDDPGGLLREKFALEKRRRSREDDR